MASDGYRRGYVSFAHFLLYLFMYLIFLQDLGLAQSAATATKSPTPLGSAAHQMYRTMTNHGFGGKDFSSAFLFLQDQDDYEHHH